MSRFFVKYDSDSSSEEEDLLSSEEEALVSSQEEDSDSDFFQNDSDESSDEDSDDSSAPKGVSYFLKSKFTKGAADSDSDSDDDRRVVKSGKEKLFDDMKESVEKLNIAKRIENWINCLAEFDKLGKLLTKSYQQNYGTPNFYIKSLGDLEEFVDISNNSEDKKKIAADQSRAFNTLRQRLKRQVKEYQELVDLYKQEPERFDSEEPIEITTNNNKDEGFTSVGVSKSLSPVFQTLKLISESRGKKNIDKFEQIQTLESLLDDLKQEVKGDSTKKVFELISVCQMLISIRFDASSNQSFMPLDQWKQNLVDINYYLNLLELNKSKYQVSEFGKSTDDIDIEPETNEKGIKVIYGSISSLIERLDDELTKSLQNSDPHSIEYIERLKDESSIYKLIVKGQLYIETTTAEVESTEGHDQLSRIILKRLDHLYYKPNQLIKSNELEGWKDIESNIDSSIISRNSQPLEIIDTLVDYLIKNSNKLFSERAILSKIYYYANNNNYKSAKELFLSSQIYLTIHNDESLLQILYNRALVQLGLSAFREGLIEESHQCLNEIANSQRLKELLGQGFSNKFPNQASITERQRLLPFHMHINLELLECVFMTSSLLIEIPSLAASSNLSKDSKRKTPIKSFKSKLEFHDKQYFTGPPESIKDHIIHASKALQRGDWLKAYNLLASIKIWNLFPDNKQLLTMMENQLQIEGLRTYIFTYKSIYSKLSINLLSTKFKLSNEKVIDIIEKMVENNDIIGDLNDDKTFINFISNETQRTKLQELAIIMKDKINILTEKNEMTASNGRGKKNIHQQKDDKKDDSQPKDKEEELNKFRYASVNSNNDEFQPLP
ncbi:eukaryotic translation initiation factor 3 subunit C [[Candida] jaroonii]|uniref:Eukaryotic translation initiation factor 3 subunit C n=1 Tax=[Candida] jaroonii TaxID=467808 RepID=A0ACA9Y6G6_9ASCO|nr:eukaryotic translation initiation factor 3 subunit C [[Candida] jaroonii]